MTWEARYESRGNSRLIRVSASIAEDSYGVCPLHLAWKSRPELWPTSEGARRSQYQGPLFRLVDAISQVHLLTDRGIDLDAAIARSKGLLQSLHAGDLAFAEHALERYFEYHEAREEELGPLRFMTKWSVVPLSVNAQLAVWGPMYESLRGDREIRRLRFSSARRDHTVWADIAAHVASKSPGRRRAAAIHVVEVGLADGCERHILAGISPAEAERLYMDHGREAANKVALGTETRPGRSCAECKLTNVCDALVPVPGVLQLERPTRSTVSVSANDLERYEACPSRWHMESEHLPSEREETEAQRRGMAVHTWLQAAHGRGVPCAHEDLVDFSDGNSTLKLADGVLEADDYRLAEPFLRSHIDVCPLRAPSVQITSIESNIYGHDTVSDVVVASKPDMVFLQDGRLVLREVKTTEKQPPIDADDARTRFLTVSLNLLLLESGLVRDYEVEAREVQLEILTPGGGYLFSYTADDHVLMAMTKSRVRNLAREWANDNSWIAKPGPHCVWCPVRRWCPDRDTYAMSAVNTERVSAGAGDDDLPPF